MSPPVAQVVHAAPGRLRLRIPAMRREPAFFVRLAEEMERQGVGNVHANSSTGSILIEGSTLSTEQIRDLARAQRWLEISHSSPQDLTVTSAALEQWQEKGVQELTRVLPFAALALAAIQVGRGQVLPPAFSLLLYALDVARSRAASLGS